MDTDKEQIKLIAHEMQMLKKKYKLTAETIISNLPAHIRISRTALNAYLYGTIKSPPSKEMIISLLKAFTRDIKEIDTVLLNCGYTPHTVNNIENLLIVRHKVITLKAVLSHCPACNANLIKMREDMLAMRGENVINFCGMCGFNVKEKEDRIQTILEE